MKIVTTADLHLRNDDSYGIYDESGVNDFLIRRTQALTEIIRYTETRKAHLVLAGDFIDSKLIDSYTLYYSSFLIESMINIPFVILMEGNHGFDDRRGEYSIISHWKHLAKENIRIITYPKIERKDSIAYHCLPAISDIGTHFLSEVKGFVKKIDKSDKCNILVVHGPVVGAAFESGKESKSGIARDHIQWAKKYYDFIVLGDIHRYQVLQDNVWYCGAPLQTSLKDKGQDRGFQVIDTDKGNFKFYANENGPRFIELNWEVGVKISKIINSPEKYKDKLHNAVVIVHLIGLSKEIDKIDTEDIRKRLKENGALRVFTESKKTDEQKTRLVIRENNNDEVVQDYCTHQKEQLPAAFEVVVNTGKKYLLSVDYSR